MADLGVDAPIEQEGDCPTGNGYNGRLGLRIAAIFIIFATSFVGTMAPILSRRMKAIPDIVYQAVKYFGSGVIIATAFIHLLAPAWDALTSPCLTGTWTEYDWAPAICMISVFLIFIVELTAHRWGASYLRKRGLRTHDAHTQGVNDHAHTTHGAHIELPTEERNSDATLERGIEKREKLSDDGEMGHVHYLNENTMSQILGVAILEFGVIFHSLIIGLTLAVDEDFTTLFIVLIFHQMFEGLGLGSRLSGLNLPSQYRWIPYAAGTLYAIITPLGTAIGLGVRQTYNPESATASIVAGLLDATSAGILLYTGLVELLAHDFIFNRHMAMEASNVEVIRSVLFVVLGAGLMSVLGRWA